MLCHISVSTVHPGILKLGVAARRRLDECFAHIVNTVEPTVLRDSRSRCACAASFSG
jgi:hypothetical protein